MSKLLNSHAPDQKSKFQEPVLPRTAFLVKKQSQSSKIVTNVFLGVEKHKLI